MAEKVVDIALSQAPYPEIRVEKLRDTAAIEELPEKTWVRIALHDYAHIKLLWKGEGNGGDVYVQGSWDGWRRSHKLKRGEYSVTLKLPTGLHEYKFRIGNNWFHDNSKTTVANCFNTLNNVINVTMTT
ncbi:5'-AMP-activated protein kinase subunit beta-1-like [Branchiostoma floridae x Branchiostoma japonicum]